MAPYVAAVIPTRHNDDVKIKVYLPIDTMKFLDDDNLKWVWDTQSQEIVDVNTSQSMHDLLPYLPAAKQYGSNAWDLRV
jgi:hypothetical protein